jgi:protein disulfide-isomerase A6
MSRFNVQGFPTILVFGTDKDSPFPYEGARAASAIESFALEQLESNVSPPEVIELTGPVSFYLFVSQIQLLELFTEASW